MRSLIPKDSFPSDYAVQILPILLASSTINSAVKFATQTSKKNDTVSPIGKVTSFPRDLGLQDAAYLNGLLQFAPNIRLAFTCGTRTIQRPPSDSRRALDNSRPASWGALGGVPHSQDVLKRHPCQARHPWLHRPEVCLSKRARYRPVPSTSRHKPNCHTDMEAELGCNFI
jgi:hypothetical protein